MPEIRVGVPAPRVVEHAAAPPPSGAAQLAVATGAATASDFYNVKLDPALPTDAPGTPGPARLRDNTPVKVDFAIAPNLEAGDLVPRAKAAVSQQLQAQGPQMLSVSLTCDFCADNQVQQQGLPYTPGHASDLLQFNILPQRQRTRDAAGKGNLVFYVKGRDGVLYDNVVVPVRVMQPSGGVPGAAYRLAPLGATEGTAAVTTASTERRAIDLTLVIGTRNDIVTVGLQTDNPDLSKLFAGRQDDCPAASPACGTMRVFDTGRRLDAIRVRSAEDYRQIGALVDQSPTQLVLTRAQESALLTPLRVAGQTLYRELFAANPDLATMIGAFEAWAPSAGHRVTVSVVSEGFTAPWQFLYPPGPGADTDPDQFWGFRYDLISDLSDRTAPGPQAAALIAGAAPVIEASFQPTADSDLAKDNQTYLAAFTHIGFKTQPIAGSGAAFLQALTSTRATLDVAAVFTHATSDLATANTGPELYFDANDKVTVDQLQDLADQVQINERFFPQQPVIFLNGCWTGTGGALVSGEASFPEEFLNLGARAVVAAETPVWKQFTAEFGSTLINQFKGPAQPLSLELLNARLAMLQQYNDPLGLVFSYYGGADVSVSVP